jgi:GNAT superfamily N-acetyltransferase
MDRQDRLAACRRTAAGRATTLTSNPFAEPRARPRLHIAPARPADASTVLEMIRGLAAVERLAHLCVATEDDLRRELFSAHPAAEVILAWEDGQPAGFALFFHNFSTFLGRRGLYLEDLFVVPAFRRRGYGRALLIYLARLALERGCGRFEWTVLDWNADAIGFYTALGANVLTDWRLTRVTGGALESLAARPLLPGKE